MTIRPIEMSGMVQRTTTVEKFEGKYSPHEAAGQNQAFQKNLNRESEKLTTTVQDLPKDQSKVDKDGRNKNKHHKQDKNKKEAEDNRKAKAREVSKDGGNLFDISI